MTAKIVENIRNIVFPILGVIFILFSNHVTRILPYLLGGAMSLHIVGDQRFSESEPCAGTF